MSGQGRGWYVRRRDPLIWHASRPERNTRTDVAPNDVWAQDVREQGREPSERIEVAMLTPDPRIADRLSLKPGDHTVVRRRLRYVDGEICMTADTYYPQDLVQGTSIAEPGDVTPGVWVVLDRLGHGWVRRSDEMIARPASIVEADRLGLTVGEPVIELLRTRYAEDGRPVALSIFIAAGDRVTVVYEGEA